MTTKYYFLPHLLGFTNLVALSSCYKLGKVLTIFESPYMVCAFCDLVRGSSGGV